ncbi:hypothetical protein JCM5350_001366 [Sporobolomyces pararoseus]
MPPLAIPARLPDELVIEVFRNSVLSNNDLANCSLVARRFVEKVRLSLYGDIFIFLACIESTGGDNNEGRSQFEDRYEYDSASRKLLRTLLDEPGIGRLVFRITFFNLDFQTIRSDSPGLETTPLTALSTFLRLTPQLRIINLGWYWPHPVASLKIIRRYQGITELTLSVVEDEQIDIIARGFPNLKRLRLRLYHVGMSAATNSFQIPQNLETIDITHGYLQPQVLLVSSNATTLRRLFVEVQLAAELDFTTFPALEALVLRSNAPNSAVTSGLNRKRTRLWNSLCQAPSLHSLTFINSSRPSAFDTLLFVSSDCEPLSGPLKPIPTLKQIRFSGSVHLNQANILLSGPLGTTLNRVCVHGLPPIIRTEEKNKIKFVEMICKEKGIEFYVNL